MYNCPICKEIINERMSKHLVEQHKEFSQNLNDVILEIVRVHPNNINNNIIYLLSNLLYDVSSQEIRLN